VTVLVGGGEAEKEYMRLETARKRQNPEKTRRNRREGKEKGEWGW
jgi:hypothetical protein